MRKLVIATALSASLLTGCAGLIAALPEIAAVVADAAAVLSIVERALDSFYAVTPPDPEVRQQANQLMSNAWTALRIATAATKGADHLSKDEQRAAFEEFRKCYSELHKFLQENGVLKGSKLSLGMGAEADIPEPLAMQL